MKRVLFYGVLVPLWIIWTVAASGPAYKHYESKFVSQMHRVEEKRLKKKGDIDMAELAKQYTPRLPAGGL